MVRISEPLMSQIYKSDLSERRETESACVCMSEVCTEWLGFTLMLLSIEEERTTVTGAWLDWMGRAGSGWGYCFQSCWWREKSLQVGDP